MRALKILFASFRYDPTDLDKGSGSDHVLYTALCRSGAHVDVLHPNPYHGSVFERAFARAYKKITKRNYSKFRLSTSYWLSTRLNQAELEYRPDLIFTMWPNFLVNYKGTTPCIYRLDSCLYGQQIEYPTYGRLAMRITEWQEQRAFNTAKLVITHSLWSKEIISNRYGVDQNRFYVFPMPSAIPTRVIPRSIDILVNKRIEFPIRLLLVGREYHRKGVDIALDIVNILNQLEYPVELVVCGLEGPTNNPYVRFAGPYNKSDPAQLEKYASLYSRAHLLIHPARFEMAGIVPAEAAAFGTPTITNNVGGLATSVADGVSGIVLPKHSPAELYAKTIVELMNDPERYHRLCETTRKHYEQELNWDVAGQRLREMVDKVVEEHKANSR